MMYTKRFHIYFPLILCSNPRLLEYMNEVCITVPNTAPSKCLAGPDDLTCRLSGGSSTSTSGTTMGTPRQWPVQVPICSHSTTMGRDGNTVHQEEEGGRPTVPPGAAVKIWSPSEDETSKYRRAVSSDALDRTGIFHCASYTVGRVCHGMVCVGSDDRIFIAADKRRARSTPSKTRAGSGVQYFSCPRTLRRERV